MSSNQMDMSEAYAKVCLLSVDKLYQAQGQDLLPDEDTERVFGMQGEQGRNLYGAFTTLILQGRICRTMMEQALMHSPTSYPECIQQWIRSLPPGQRSHYTDRLCKSNFKDIVWDTALYQNVSQRISHTEGIGQFAPPVALGDDRHSPLHAAACQYSYSLYSLINYDVLCSDTTRSGDVHAPLNREYEGQLREYGKLFGVDVSELNWTDRSENRTLSNSELVLRCWNCLYYAQRLSLTQLECALVGGPDEMRNLLSYSTFVATNYTMATQDRFALEGHGLLKQLNTRDCLGETEFEDLRQRNPADEHLSCDYCGEELPKRLQCSRCKVAQYCSRDHQQEDFKRHKKLCLEYEARNPQIEDYDNVD